MGGFPTPDAVGIGRALKGDCTMVTRMTLLSLALRISARSGLSPSSTISNIRTPEKEKMSQFFSHNINSLNTSYNVSVSNNFTTTDDRSNVLSWLSPLDPKSRHRDIQGRRVEGIGEWLLQTAEFRSWHTGGGVGDPNDAVLFCYGDPGVGKTYIR